MDRRRGRRSGRWEIKGGKGGVVWEEGSGKRIKCWNVVVQKLKELAGKQLEWTREVQMDGSDGDRFIDG